MMRLVFCMAFMLFATHAVAWTFNSDSVCRLSYTDDSVSVEVTYDPAVPQYAISVTNSALWAGEPIFAMRFDGVRPNLITTNRHVLSDGGSTVTVIDRGFGNVLNGLEFNAVATALLGDQSVSFPLEGAAPEVQKFRACAEGVGV